MPPAEIPAPPLGWVWGWQKTVRLLLLVFMPPDQRSTAGAAKPVDPRNSQPSGPAPPSSDATAPPPHGKMPHEKPPHSASRPLTAKPRVALGEARLSLEPPLQYPSAMVNVTNRCNLTCKHCFVYRDGNPNDADGEMTPERVLAELRRLRDRHGLRQMLWMGGEPMIRWRMLEQGLELFERNTITTNGTIPLKDFGPNVTYVISLDGPRDVNDAVRGQGVFDRVMETVAAIPDDFAPTVMVQCVVHRENQHRLAELVEMLLPTKVQGMTFSFYVPCAGERSPRAWDSVEEREEAVDIVVDLKRRYPDFVWNSRRSLELMRPATAKMVTDHCPIMTTTMPLYIEGDHFTTPFCCYGNDVDCDRCGAWAVFAVAAKMSGPWDELVPGGESSSSRRNPRERDSEVGPAAPQPAD